MDIDFFCTLWGFENHPLEDFVNKVKAAGYAGVEVNIPEDKAYAIKLKELLEQYDLSLLAQLYLPPEQESVSRYIERMEQRLIYMSTFDPIFINAHTGRDFFSFEDNCRVIEYVAGISERTQTKIIHETHRGRFNFSAFSTMPYLIKYPDLRLTADFSHWCNVSESLLEDQKEAVDLAIRHSDHIHARVGFVEGPQVNDPRAPEWETTLNRHLSWWDAIVAQNKKDGKAQLTITPEFGPPPYMPVLPYTNQPVVSQWEVNLFMMDLLKKRYLGNMSRA